MLSMCSSRNHCIEGGHVIADNSPIAQLGF